MSKFELQIFILTFEFSIQIFKIGRDLSAPTSGTPSTTMTLSTPSDSFWENKKISKVKKKVDKKFLI